MRGATPIGGRALGLLRCQDLKATRETRDARETGTYATGSTHTRTHTHTHTHTRTAHAHTHAWSSIGNVTATTLLEFRQ